MSSCPLVRPRSNDDVLDDTSNESRSNNGDLYHVNSYNDDSNDNSNDDSNDDVCDNSNDGSSSSSNNNNNSSSSNSNTYSF